MSQQTDSEGKILIANKRKLPLPFHRYSSRGIFEGYGMLFVIIGGEKYDEHQFPVFRGQKEDFMKSIT